MSPTRSSQRTHVSYIDRTRDYYAACGYPSPYQWARHSDAPFTKLSKPLAECTVGVVTTSYLRDAEPAQFDGRPDQPYARPLADAEQTETAALPWDKESTHTDDRETYLPLQRLAEAAGSGRIGAAAPRFYGVPTQYSHHIVRRQHAPEIEQAMRDDDVDVAILIPL